MSEIFIDSHIHMKDYENGAAMLDSIAALGVSGVIINSLPSYRSIADNLASLYFKLNYKRMKVMAFGGLHQLDIFSDIPYEEQAKKLIELGFDGMKFLDMKPDFRKTLGKGLNDKSYDKMFSLLEERGIPITIHCADPEKNWDINKVSPGALAAGWFYGDGTFKTKQELYDETFEMLDKHPKLKVSLAHFFFLSNFIDEAERVLTKYPNVYFDLTPGWEMYVGFSSKIEEWHDFFNKYSDRILFGTDTDTFSDPAKLHELVYTALTHDYTEFAMPCYGGHIIKGLNLSDEVVNKICVENPLRFLGDGNESDINSFNDAARRMLEVISDNAVYERETKWLKTVLGESDD